MATTQTTSKKSTPSALAIAVLAKRGAPQSPTSSPLAQRIIGATANTLQNLSEGIGQVSAQAQPVQSFADGRTIGELNAQVQRAKKLENLAIQYQLTTEEVEALFPVK